jgi:hypothetical protein
MKNTLRKNKGINGLPGEFRVPSNLGTLMSPGFLLGLWIISFYLPMGIGNPLFAATKKRIAEENEHVVLEPMLDLQDVSSYQWWKDGTPLPGRDERILIIDRFRPKHAGSYSIRFRTLSGEALIERVSEVVPDNVEEPSLAEVQASSDLTGDGFSEILFQHENGPLAAWSMDSNNYFDRFFIEPSLSSDSNWTLVTTGRINQDFIADVLFQHSSGLFGVWYMSNPNELNFRGLNKNVSERALLELGGASKYEWSLIGAADFDGNRFSELVFLHSEGAIAIGSLRENKLKWLEIYPDHPLLDDGSFIAAIADFDLDSKAEILTVSEAGELRLWNLDRTQHRFTMDRLSEASFDNSQWRIVAVADYDNNRSPDLVFRDILNGDLIIWLMDKTQLRQTQFVAHLNPVLGWRISGP